MYQGVSNALGITVKASCFLVQKWALVSNFGISFFFCQNFAFFLLPQVFPVIAYRCISHNSVVYFRTAPPSTFPVLTVKLFYHLRVKLSINIYHRIVIISCISLSHASQETCCCSLLHASQASSPFRSPSSQAILSQCNATGHGFNAN